MANKSKIEWTRTTWNPVVGCSKVGPGCANCYAERMANRIAGAARKPPNHTSSKFRIGHLRKTRAAFRFLSIEALWGPIGDLNLDGTDWVSVGGESEPGAKPVAAAQVIDIRDQCVRSNVCASASSSGAGSVRSKTVECWKGESGTRHRNNYQNTNLLMRYM